MYRSSWSRTGTGGGGCLMQCMGRAAHHRSCRRRGREGSRWACTGSSTILVKGTSRYRRQQLCAAGWNIILALPSAFCDEWREAGSAGCTAACCIGTATASQGVQRMSMPACMSCLSPALRKAAAPAQECMGAGRAHGTTQLALPQAPLPLAPFGTQSDHALGRAGAHGHGERARGRDQPRVDGGRCQRGAPAAADGAGH